LGVRGMAKKADKAAKKAAKSAEKAQKAATKAEKVAKKEKKSAKKVDKHKAKKAGKKKAARAEGLTYKTPEDDRNVSVPQAPSSGRAVIIENAFAPKTDADESPGS